MSVLYNVYDLVQKAASIYGAIDIRCVAFNQPAGWANAMAVIRLTYEDVATAETRIRKHFQRFRPVQTDFLRVDWGVRPFSEWEQLCAEFRETDFLQVGDFRVRLARQPHRNDLAKFGAYLQWNNPDVRPFDGRDWPELRVRFESSFPDAHPLLQGPVINASQRAGYADAFEVANHLCEINVSQSSPGADVTISIPLFATISGTKVSTSKKCVDVQIDCHKDLAVLEVMAALRPSTTTHVGEPYREEHAISSFSGDGSGPIVSKSGSVEFGEIESDDWIRVRLTHPEIGEITRRENVVRRLIPPAEGNILLEAVKPFLKETSLDDLLVRAYDERPPKLNEGAGFELHVSWLLSLFGFSTILLGNYEHIIAPHTKVQRSSVDILAANQGNKLLLAVGCTITAPEIKDFGNLRNARDILQREVFAETGVSVIPVLFTCTTSAQSYNQNDDFLDMLPIIDGDSMKLLLAHAQRGEEHRFYQFLMNPSLNYLGDTPL